MSATPASSGDATSPGNPPRPDAPGGLRALIRRPITVALFMLAGLGIGAPCAYIAYDGLHDDLQPVDLAVVLGNRVEPNGQPSARLKARLDRAVEVYRARLTKRILVSGGFGREGVDEAKAMKQYLVTCGVPASDIDEDGAGSDTFLTARHTAQLMQQQRYGSVMIVTQWFHITRTRMALRGFGVSPIRSTHANYFELRDIWSLVREAIGCADYAFRSYRMV